MYLGEVVISTDILEEFMTTAKSLQIRGLTKSNNLPEKNDENKRKQSTSSENTSNLPKRTKLTETPLVQNDEVKPSISTAVERITPETKIDQDIKIEYVEMESSPATPNLFCEGMTFYFFDLFSRN